jgi:hypothetical protein
MSRYKTLLLPRGAKLKKRLDLKGKVLPGLVDRQDESHEDHKKVGEVNQS